MKYIEIWEIKIHLKDEWINMLTCKRKVRTKFPGSSLNSSGSHHVQHDLDSGLLAYEHLNDQKINGRFSELATMQKDDIKIKAKKGALE